MISVDWHGYCVRLDDMKTKWTTYGIGLISLALMPALATSLPAAEVKLEWEDPKTFSDMEEDGFYSEKLFTRFSEKFEDFVKEEASEYLPEDALLSITVKDVELAGEYEFWRGSGFEDVRIMKDIYPPRLKFSYTVKDADGQLVKEGMAQITDMTYLWNVADPVRRSKAFYYELQLMEDWLRQELKDISMAGS